MRASSAQFDDDQNQLQLSGYTTFDALARRNINRNFSVFAAVENLFDQRIESGKTPFLTIASPRSFRAGIRLEFLEK
jgi:outer membrane receptor protein involved in Fe transport